MEIENRTAKGLLGKARAHKAHVLSGNRKVVRIELTSQDNGAQMVLTFTHEEVAAMAHWVEECRRANA